MSASRDRQLAYLWDTLLERAGGWGVLSPAMDELRRLERIHPSATAAEWAERALAIIDRRRAANARACEGDTRRNPPMLLTDAQVVAHFGDPTPYLRPDGSIDDAWATAQLAQLELPAPLPLSWDRSHTVSRLRVHRKLVGAFRAALEAVHANPAAWASLGDTGGVYAWRPQRGAKRLSRHCWGIAIDLDVADNPLGAAAAKMHPDVVAAFRAAGFEWGGSWRTRKDPMHFEFTDVARLSAG